MKNALLNFRVFTVVALSVTCSVFACMTYAAHRTSGIIMGCAVIFVCALLAAIFSVMCVKRRVRLRVPIAFGLALAMSVCVFAVGARINDGWKSGYGYEGYCYVSGRVCSTDIRTGKYRVDLDDVTFNGESVDGYIRVTFAAEDNNVAEFVKCGDILSFGADIRVIKLFSDGHINGSAYRSDVRFTATVQSNDVTLRLGSAKPLEVFTDSMHKFYTKNMGDKYGNIAFSILTGDKRALDSGISSYFSEAGIGHILAVSGLHIGFLILILNFVLSKFNRKIRYAVILIVLLGYTVLADFSPSVIRAVIMAVVSGIGILLGGRRDLLSSLFCAYSLILCVKPYYMFESGFLFSFSSIFGIAMFANPIKRKLTKHGVGNKTGNALSASVSVSASTFPASSYLVGNINPIAVVANAILIPYITVIFISIVCLSPIAAIPGCGGALTVPKYMLTALDYVAMGLSLFPASTVPLRTTGAIFMCYPVMYAASGYVMFPKKCRTAVVLYSAAVVSVLMLLYTL